MNIPNTLKALHFWLVWRLVHFPGEKKPRKVPYYANGSIRSDTPGSEPDLAQLTTYDAAMLAAERGNYSGVGLAILPDTGVTAWDFDDCVTPDGTVDQRVLDLVEGTYAEFSPSGTGVRAFFQGTLPSRKKTKPEPGQLRVEVFGTSGFVTVTGRQLPDCEFFGFGVEPVTPAAREFYNWRFGAPIEDAGDLGFLATVTPRLGLSIVQAADMLASISADCGYEDWLGVGQALHHEFNGSAEALNLFDEWSRGAGERYAGRKAVEGKWASFGRYTGHPKTMASVAKMAADARARERYDVRQGWAQQISDTKDEFALREKVCKGIQQDTRLGEIEREELAQALLSAFKALGTKLPIAQCRKMLQPKRVEKVHSELPEWAQGWVYVTDDDKFYRIDSEEWLTMQGFNAKFNREMPRNEEGNIVEQATWFALNDLEIKHVTRAAYVPFLEDTFTLDGTECVNLYRRSSVPQAELIGDAGQRAIALIEGHIRLIAGGREEIAQTLLAWLAHNVQRPGVKIRWSPLVKGVEGDGKTLLGTLLSGVMGQVNVKVISNDALASGFTGWAAGACVGVLEEVRVIGSQTKTRYDVFNALKPYVTNDRVPVHPKGKDEFNIMNVTNYLGFTNFNDALPLNDNDRRWMVIFTPWADIAQMEAAVGGGLAAYFDRLIKAVHAHVGELRTWLLSYPLPATFEPNGRAPVTDEKRLMIALSSSSEEDAVREVIEEGAVGVGQEVLSTWHLNAALQMRQVEQLKTTALSRVLLKMGWTKVPKPMKWQDRPCTVWVRGKVPADTSYLRDSLEKASAKAREAFSDGFDPLFGPEQ